MKLKLPPDIPGSLLNTEHPIYHDNLGLPLMVELLVESNYRLGLLLEGQHSFLYGLRVVVGSTAGFPTQDQALG